MKGQRRKFPLCRFRPLTSSVVNWPRDPAGLFFGRGFFWARPFLGALWSGAGETGQGLLATASHLPRLRSGGDVEVFDVHIDAFPTGKGQL